MNIRYSYTPYCSSWIKFLLLGYHPIYCAHNLYAEYKYNQSLEAELAVEMQGEIHTIKASPSYFNWYTGYNALMFLADYVGNKFCMEENTRSNGKVVMVLLVFGAFICKLISLKDDYKYQEYKFIDVDTGAEIASKDMEYLNILDIKYINNPQEVIDHQDEVSDDNNYQVELDNHDIMEMSA